MRILLLAWVREALRRPLLFLLSVLGVALGVATVVAVDIANDSARKSFLASNEALAGAATHRISGDVTDEIYAAFRLSGRDDVTPVVEGPIRVQRTDGLRVTLYGVDILAERGFRSNPAWRSLSPLDAANLITSPFGILVTRETADRLNLEIGERIDAHTSGGRFELQLIGLLNPANPLQRQSLQSVFLTDISTAQVVLGMTGKLSAINLQLDISSSVDEIRALLPASAEVESYLSRNVAQVEITRAFQTNLKALGLLALLVAMFLVYNTMSFLVMRRRQRIGIARTLGVTRREIIGCVLLEALTVGAIATIIGFAFGVQLSKLLLSLVERSIESLYFPIHASIVVISPPTVIAAITLGIVATIVSALPAAQSAASVSPVQTLHRSGAGTSATGRTLYLASGGVTSLVAGAALIWIDQRSIAIGFLAILLLILGYMFLVPLLLARMSAVFHPLIKTAFGIRGVLASRAFSASHGQASIAVLALCLAISATVGVGVMIGSFRDAVDDWLSNRLTGDVYITTSFVTDSTAPDRGLSQVEVDQLRVLEGVESVGVATWTELLGPGGPVSVFAVDYGEKAFSGFKFKEQVSGTIWDRFLNDGVIVSEPYAWKHKISVDSELTLTRRGQSFRYPVLGVYYDYGSDRGIVAMHRSTYVKDFTDNAISSAVLFGKPDADFEQLGATVQNIVTTHSAVIWRNHELKQASLEVFDQTFAITGVLRTLAIIVAFVAVVSALAAMQIERERELSVLRATGFTSREIWSLTSVETGMMGVIAAILALPLGAVMAWLLIWVINQRSFGWTMQMQLNGTVFIQAVALSGVAALVAGMIPAWRIASRIPARYLQALE